MLCSTFPILLFFSSPSLSPSLSLSLPSRSNLPILSLPPIAIASNRKKSINQTINQSLAPKSLNYITPLPISMPSLSFAFSFSIVVLYSRCWQICRVLTNVLWRPRCL
ncbi:hypothetical protein HOY82DRAFT_6404 [Tuber indicum]|nr:hypothetical protein HOY82DRAFT_6404 [Tuber indicum]